MRKPTLQRLMLQCLCAAACAGLTGCAVVTVHNGTVEQSRHFGVVNIAVRPDVAAATVVVTRSFGLAMGLRTGSLGYLDEVAFIAPDAGKCRVMVVITGLSDLKDLEAQLSNRPIGDGLCFATPTGVKS